MNIVLIYHGGLGDDLKLFYDKLARISDFNVTVIVPSETIINSFYSKNIPAVNSSTPPYKLVKVGLINKRRYNWGFAPLALLRALRTAQPNLIHVFNEYHCFPVAQVVVLRNFFLNKQIPIFIYAFQNIDPLRIKGQGLLKTFKKMITAAIVRYNLRHINGVTGASEEAIEIIKHYKKGLACKKIPWGVETSLFFPKEKTACREKLCLPSDKKIIGYFGRIVEEKGLVCLLKAAEKLPETCVLLLGDGPYLGPLQRIASELKLTDRVIFRPPVARNELNDYYNSLDCFVLPSESKSAWKEQYGRVLIEAMACEIPITGSSSGAIPEVLKGYGRGLIFKEGDVGALAGCIEHCFRLKEAPINRKYPENFDTKRFTENHAEFYKSLLKSK